jgi:hypothetical protein
MTVGELKRLLENIDDGLEVFISFSDDEMEPIGPPDVIEEEGDTWVLLSPVDEEED